MPEAPKNPEGTKEQKRHWLDHATVVAAAAAALAAAAAAGAGAWQASIANQQLAVSKDSEQKQLRAYVGITPQGIENFGTPDQVLTATRKNYGATPAYDMFISPGDVHIQMLHQNDPIPSIVGINYPPPGIGAFTLFPGMEIPYYFRANSLSPKQDALVEEGNEFKIVYYGILYYRDTFSDPHYTRFCWMYKGKEMTAKDTDVCFGHNDSN